MSGAAVVLGDLVIPPIAGEAEGIFYRSSAAFIVKERAERVISVIILDSARFVDKHSNAAQAVVQVAIELMLVDTELLIVRATNALFL